MSYAAYKKYSRDRRARAMRGYNRDSRRKRSAEGAPTTRHVHQAALHVVLTLATKYGHLARSREKLIRELVLMGFDAVESRAVVKRVVCEPTDVSSGPHQQDHGIAD